MPLGIFCAAFIPIVVVTVAVVVIVVVSLAHYIQS